MKKLPRLIYVTIDTNSEGGEDLLAWRSLAATDNGRIGTYRLVEEYDKRETPELRRLGTKAWFKSLA